MDEARQANLPAPTYLPAYRCSDVDVLLTELHSRIDELELAVDSARDREAVAVATLTDLTALEQRLGRMLLEAERRISTVRSQAQQEARGIIDDAEAEADRIRQRAESAVAGLLDVVVSARSSNDDVRPPEPPQRAPVIDLSERKPASSEVAPPHASSHDDGAQGIDPYLAALRSSLFDDPAFGPLPEAI